jgi:hypothetical protein
MAGIFGDLIDSFTGKGARREIDAGMAKSTEALDRARSDYLSRSGEARGYMQPYAEAGGRTFNLYNDTLGVNGGEARQKAQDLYYSDPNQQRITDLALRSGDRASNASGYFTGGRGALLSGRLAQEQYGNWQNRLAQGGQQGQQAATTLSGIASNEGNALAGLGQAQAGVYQSGYGQRAQASNTFAQNLIGLAGTAVRAFNPLGGYNNLSRPTGGGAMGGP